MNLWWNVVTNKMVLYGYPVFILNLQLSVNVAMQIHPWLPPCLLPVGRYWHIWPVHWRSPSLQCKMVWCWRSWGRSAIWQSLRRPSYTPHTSRQDRPDPVWYTRHAHIQPGGQHPYPPIWRNITQMSYKFIRFICRLWAGKPACNFNFQCKTSCGSQYQNLICAIVYFLQHAYSHLSYIFQRLSFHKPKTIIF